MLFTIICVKFTLFITIINKTLYFCNNLLWEAILLGNNVALNVRPVLKVVEYA